MKNYILSYISSAFSNLNEKSENYNEIVGHFTNIDLKSLHSFRSFEY